MTRATLARSVNPAAGITARLAREDWNAMPLAAQASPRNPANLDYWRAVAAQNAALDAEQVDRLAVTLRSAHFSALGRRSGAARRSGGRRG